MTTELFDHLAITLVTHGCGIGHFLMAFNAMAKKDMNHVRLP
jgi:hypothetical protein